MKLSKNSWHFRLTDKVIYGGNLTSRVKYGMQSLCPYFWAVMISCFVVGVAFPLAASILLWVLTSPFWAPFFEDYAILGNIFAIVDAILLLAFWAKFREAKYNQVFPDYIHNLVPKRSNRPYKERKPSILVQRLKAGHDKICPIFELDE